MSEIASLTPEGSPYPNSRAEAKAQGAKQYFTGKPCKHGHIDKRSTHTGRCFECDRQAKARERADNPEAVRARKNALRLVNLEAARERDRSRNRDPIKMREYSRKFRERHAEQERQRGREKYAQAKAKDPERLRVARRKREAKRFSTARGKLENAISAGIHRGLKNGAKAGRRTFDLLGYELDDLISHIERQFKSGMTWDNYGISGWHIDHRIPRSVFNFETPDDIDFKRCWSLENLQPLWGADNISKGAKLDAPFQPSLAIH